MNILAVNNKEYHIIKLLGKGKGGYSYLVTDGEAVYCLTASFPAAGGVDYGAAFDAMVETFEVMK